MSIQYVLEACIWSFIACAACSVYLNVNGRDIIWGGILAIINWVGYLLIKHYTGSVALAYFFASFAVAVGAEILAVFKRNPATIYLLPGILPLVPGAGIFSMMRSAILENMNVALQKLYEVAGAAGSIALGIAIASSFFKVFHHLINISRQSKDQKMVFDKEELKE